MNTTFNKFAAAIFAACFAVTGYAFAEEAHTQDNSAMLEQVYAKIDMNRAKTFKIVMASAEDRLSAKIANIEMKAPAAPVFILASN